MGRETKNRYFEVNAGILVKIQKECRPAAYLGHFGLCQAKGRNTDWITSKNAVAVYLLPWGYGNEVLQLKTNLLC